MTITKLILIGALTASVALPTAVRADRLEINVGDRGFHTHGDRYWADDYEMIWVAGHESHGHWIHGHYRKGEHRQHHEGDRHDDHNGDHHDNDRH